MSTSKYFVDAIAAPVPAESQGPAQSQPAAAKLISDQLKQLFMDATESNNLHSPIRQRKQEQNNGTKIARKSIQSEKKTPAAVTLIELAPQSSEPIVKSPMFMTAPSSIYMAVHEYYSLMDAFHYDTGTRASNGKPGIYYFPHHCLADNYNRSSLESCLKIIDIYFGGCPKFRQTFNTVFSMSNNAAEDKYKTGRCTKSISLATILENALHRSVRHLCSHECFFRAYHPIREFTFLWRDIRAKKYPELSYHFELSRNKILSGWRCRLCRRRLKNIPHSTSSESRNSITIPHKSLVFISPDGVEFNTKTKSVIYMNTLLLTPPSSILRPSKPITSTLMIDVLTKMNSLYSPFGLLEELFVSNPWRLLVSTICLNVTTRVQVDKVLHEFFLRWPDACSTANELNWKEISHVISPLGLGIKRAKALIRFSKEYLFLIEKNDPFSLTESQVKSLYNIGRYAWAAYELFILKKLPSRNVKVCDHTLQLYVEYQLGRHITESLDSVVHK